MTNQSYEHRQRGTLMLRVAALMLVGFVVLVTFVPELRSVHWVVLLGLAIITIGPLLLFSSMTIRINRDSVDWHFSLGFWHKSLARSDIANVSSIDCPWWWGWGIRLTPKGWLYRVSGDTAIQLRTSNGKEILLGTDDASGASKALAER